jgi:hypothetical protein
VGWQDRDWAKWTDDERARMVGGSPVARCPSSSHRMHVTALGALVSLVGSLTVWHIGFLRPAHPVPAIAPQPPTVVYGTGLAHIGGSPATCTALATDGQGVERCTTWTLLVGSERAAQAAALPAGGPPCAAVVASQTSGSWVCTAGAPT